MKYPFCLLTLLLIFSSCSKSGSVQKALEFQAEDVLIEREVYTQLSGEVTTAEFSYDGKKLLSAESSDGYSINYTYESELLMEVDLIESGTNIIHVDLDYDSGKLNSYTASFINGLVERFDFNYISENSILVMRYTGDETAQEFEADINVVLENQNIKSVNFPGYSLQYEYDTSNCTYKNIFAIDILNYIGLDFGGFEGIINNPTLRTETEDGETEILTFNHSYNSQSFPSETVVYKNGVEEGTVVYIYK